MTRARRLIGETTSFLLCPGNQLLLQDLWKRFTFTAAGVNTLSATLRPIKGRSSTVVIARGIPNACTIATLISKYAGSVADAPQVPTLWLHADLAARGMYSVAKLAKEYGSWVFNIEDAIIISMDVAMRCRAGISGEHYLNPAGLERYTNRAVYDVAEDAELLKWAVPTELRARFDQCSTLQNVGVLFSSYEINPETSTKQIPLIFVDWWALQRHNSQR